MAKYLVQRLLLVIPTILGVIFVVMLTLDLVPGDPAALMLGNFATEDRVDQLRRELGLDRPLFHRYVIYIGDLARGDFGRSIREQRPAIAELREALPFTLQLAFAAMFLVVVIGVPLGIASAVRRNGWIDNVTRLFSLVGLAMPVFWSGLLFVLLFSYYLRWLPVGGAGSWRHLILPAVTLALPALAVITRMTRSSILEVLHSDYIRTAKAKGLHNQAVVIKHALRNAMLPIITLMGLQLGQMLGGAILVETVFSWPGLGRLMLRAISNRDYILLQGAVLVFALAFVLVNLLVDLFYAMLNPRIRYG